MLADNRHVKETDENNNTWNRILVWRYIGCSDIRRVAPQQCHSKPEGARGIRRCCARVCIAGASIRHLMKDTADTATGVKEKEGESGEKNGKSKGGKRQSTPRETRHVVIYVCHGKYSVPIRHNCFSSFADWWEIVKFADDFLWFDRYDRIMI